MVKTVYDIVKEVIDDNYDHFDLTDEVQRTRFKRMIISEISYKFRTSVEESKRVEKFLFVEDGSVDLDELQERLMITNPEIQIVVYRQGSIRPDLISLED